MTRTDVAVTASAPHERLAMQRLSYGFDVAAGVLVLYTLVEFSLHFRDDTRALFVAIGWAVLLVSAVAALTVRWRNPEQAPRWLFPASLVAWAIAIGFDLAGTWTSGAPTVTVAAGVALILFATVVRLRLLVIAGGVIGLVLIVAFLLRLDTHLDDAAPALIRLAIASIPSMLAVYIVRQVRALVRLETDRAQAQSTVSAPRFAVGMLASEELAKLDLDAERLLDDVATGRAELPLIAERSEAAATLATELRLHLIRGRRETWLHHAVSESAFLGPSVTVSDPESLAGLLSPAQRDGLLAAIWLLVSDPVNPIKKTAAVPQTLTISIAHGTPTLDSPVIGRNVRMSIDVGGVPRSGVDPATWQAIKKVGSFEESVLAESYRIEVDCVIEASME